MHIFIFICNTIDVKGDVNMKPFTLKGESKSENKTVRFPTELLERINSVLVGSNSTFSSFVIQACEYALDNMEDTTNTKDK